MISFTSFYQEIADDVLHHWLEDLPAILGKWQREHKHGELPKWEKVLKKLPEHPPVHLDLESEVAIGRADEVSESEIAKLTSLLSIYKPWRKGPYRLYDIHIDTEWRSDWKWDRLKDQISPLNNRLVLDVGCGNGYHMWRMLGAGARRVVGVDPSTLFLCQFEAVKKLAGGKHPIHLLPIGIQDLPAIDAFDTVFSMGVLYHRRSPIDHLFQLKNQLRDGGELVLETLVVEGDEQQVLVPHDRYAKMNNVWYLPSPAALMLWLTKCGFENVRMVNLDTTSLAEQRSTEWMPNESLVDYLDPNDITKTVEGYPAPLRATFVATKPYNPLS
ncbi:tRNA 5-methoxyuridine(34)/uridine 5-oxyacetic acid(34) synthase CmoB [Paraferrimonas sedimenticola]|uniref:tRNA U34 carboxymethyltransferase n=1 Tax=Paraferrimonas sedimenticola TaxID=375674 RepID=A0AA37RVJ6_9GAMM|nr:tRNA 5-methoxyuridine(34)/uridine 5-oxyacetic acid(34) synthase CmoB [Paraferrimonas sedimenticola]GLP96165.1 tRNA U34 carboxymethyltransferase [Paraferrimonas sedimenticola]